MDYKDIIVNFTPDSVAEITLNRPEIRNALTKQMRAELLAAIKHAVESKARVILFKGDKSGFCSGQDLSDPSNIANVDIEGILRDEYEPLLRAIYDCPIPTVAAVKGAAAGAGANLALACDVVIAAHSAYFVQAFSRIGLIPDAGGTYWLPRQIGVPRALGAALFAEKIMAKEAAHWGMIWEAVADDDFDAHLEKRILHLAKGPSHAFKLAKQAIRGSLDKNLNEQLDYEAELQGQAAKSPDFLEGVMAFLEKRLPVFKGQ